MILTTEKIVGYVVLTENGDRSYFLHKIHPHFEVTLAPSTRVYEFILNVGTDDGVDEQVGDK